MRVNSGVLRKRSTDILELGFLLIARDGDVAPLVGDDAVLERRIVEPAAQAKHAPKLLLLFWRELEFVLERLAHRLALHSIQFCLIGAVTAIARSPAQADERLTTRPQERLLASG
jgi:hypothetical protein